LVFGQTLDVFEQKGRFFAMKNLPFLFAAEERLSALNSQLSALSCRRAFLRAGGGLRAIRLSF
jgi:hypothetical protein